MGSVSRRRSLVSEASNASVTCQSSQVEQTVFPVRPRLLFNDGELPQTGRFEKCRLVPYVAIYTNSRGNTIPRSSNKDSGRNGDQPLVRNGDGITSATMHMTHVQRPSVAWFLRIPVLCPNENPGSEPSLRKVRAVRSLCSATLCNIE